MGPTAVIGARIDLTACPMLPTRADGTPLCLLPELRAAPHAWVKPWKHHAPGNDMNTLRDLRAHARGGTR